VTEPCPTTGYTCVNTLVARVQTVADQASGLAAAVRSHLVDVSVDQMLSHYSALIKLLESALEAYTEGHGSPSLTDDIASIQWLLNGLGG